MKKYFDILIISLLSLLLLGGATIVDKQTEQKLGVGAFPVAVGGTGNTTLPSNALLVGNGTGAITGTTSPTVGYVTGTSTTATSTFANGINVTGGCLAVSGSCLGGGSGHDPVTLAGTPDYITLSEQELTRALINLGSHITGILPIANGGTATSTQTTNGINFFNGSQISSNELFTFDGTGVDITVPDTGGAEALTINQNDNTNSTNAFAINDTTDFGYGVLYTKNSDSAFPSFFRTLANSASPAVSDWLFDWDFAGKTDTAATASYGGITLVLGDPSNSSKDSYWQFQTFLANTSKTILTLGNGINGILVGSGGAGIVSSNGNNDLILQTGNSTTGTITLTDGANGNFTFSPNGTGSSIFSGVLQIPNGTAPVANDPGELAHDTSDNQLILDDFVVAKATQKIWATTVASTSPAFISGGLLKVPTELDGYTMTAIRCSVQGGTSKVIAVEDESANSTEDITCGTSVTSDDGSITNATATAAEEMYIDFGATTGSVDYVSISVFGNWVRE